jgi:pimeloyl-ACP methyl ester carboxylesterase
VPLALPVGWLTPAPTDQPQRSFARVARELAGEARLTLQALEVWRLPPLHPYDMGVEVDAVRRLAERLGGRVHLFGFSAGATVALAAALSLGDAVASLALCEPATIGDDEWSPVEVEWREAVDAVRHLEPAGSRVDAFAALVLPAGAALPAGRRTPPSWDTRRDRLEDLLAHVGFTSDDLHRLAQPCLVLTGSDSHERFGLLAERLVDVVSDARSSTYPGTSHLEPPMRAQPARVAADLLSFWAAAERGRRTQ